MALSAGVSIDSIRAIMSEVKGAIVGVGASRRFSAVNWGIAGRIVWAWVLTIPCSALIGAIFWKIGQYVL